MSIEHNSHQIIRSVVDTIQQCNLRCRYCHPGKTWEEKVLSSKKIEDVFETVEKNETLEVTLTGGEITLHPELARILESTHILDKTVSTLITNGTLLTPEIIRDIRNSNIDRICISLDGITPETHNYGRGDSFKSALNGLYLLQESNKDVTVISVAHNKNYKRVIELSNFLAQNKLASQHHICAPSYSGSAKECYDEFYLRQSDFFELQSMIDNSFKDLNNSGLYITFNSFWPATGQRSSVDKSRTITLVQLTEQLKNCYLIVRPNGDVRLTSSAWGRETIGNAIVGNLNVEPAELSFKKAEIIYRQGQVKQLPREIEAVHKFNYGINTDTKLTNKILENRGKEEDLVEMVSIKPLIESDIFQNILSLKEVVDLSVLIKNNPGRYRLINLADNSYIMFDKKTTHVTLLKTEEVKIISDLIL